MEKNLVGERIIKKLIAMSMAVAITGAAGVVAGTAGVIYNANKRDAEYEKFTNTNDHTKAIYEGYIHYGTKYSNDEISLSEYKQKTRSLGGVEFNDEYAQEKGYSKAVKYQENVKKCVIATEASAIVASVGLISFVTGIALNEKANSQGNKLKKKEEELSQ